MHVSLLIHTLKRGFFMNETLWISLPQQQINGLEEVANLIKNKNIKNLSINQLIEKLGCSPEADCYWEADSWIKFLGRYNAIPGVNNLDTSEMLNRAESVRDKFEQHGYSNLKDKIYSPNELISLVILCYSNPNLIGAKLSKALNENDNAGIQREILENSALVRAQGRVVPWASNLRLLNYALYANDTSVQLPTGVLNRIRAGAEANHISLYEIGNQLREIRSTCNTNEPVYLELQDNRPYVDHKLIGESPAAYNTVSGNNSNEMLIGGLVGFHVLSNVPVVSAVIRNMGNSLSSGLSSVASFFVVNNDKDLNDHVENCVECVSTNNKALN